MNFEDIISQVSRPGRYLGNELNAVKKNHKEVEIKFALCYPDLYEVGMSHLGLRIIYGLLNSLPHICCERVFAPAQDLEQVLRKNEIKLFSLETHTALAEFDIIGFSLNYELCCTNLLNILDLAGIPLESKNRDESFPLVIAGGSVCLNPEPLAEFIDLFCIGEAEELILEILETYRKFKVQGSYFPAGPLVPQGGIYGAGKAKFKIKNKQEFLLELARIEGIYVPSLYEVEYNKNGTINKFLPKYDGVPTKIKRRIVANLDEAYFPKNWIIPFTQIVHDRIMIEIMRGCPNGCRFCQAYNFYHPARFRSVETILNIAKEVYKNTGYEELSLLSLSSSDHPKLKEIIENLSGFFKDRYVSLSLPSLKPKSFLEGIPGLLAQVKKTTLTFAPEVASDHLKKIINKNIDVQQLFDVGESLFRAGYRHLKLYFMIGLLEEKESDLDGIIELAVSLSRLRLKIDSRLARINLSISAFIPKPQTPFQWLEMQDISSLERKKDYLALRLKASKPHMVNLQFHNFKMGFLEAAISRGDRRLCRVILSAWKRGAKFDAWKEYFSFSSWMEAFKEEGLSPNFYVLRKRSFDEILPWQHIEAGHKTEDLEEQLQKALTINEL